MLTTKEELFVMKFKKKIWALGLGFEVEDKVAELLKELLEEEKEEEENNEKVLQDRRW